VLSLVIASSSITSSKKVPWDSKRFRHCDRRCTPAKRAAGSNPEALSWESGLLPAARFAGVQRRSQWRVGRYVVKEEVLFCYAAF